MRGLDALRRARKPVLICAPEGRSEAARRSIVAHTGALAGNTGLRDAWLQGHGVDPGRRSGHDVRGRGAALAHRRSSARAGVAAALQSGGACTLFAEAAGAAGLSLPEFAPATKRALKKALPHFASQNNPLDVTGQAAVETDMFCGALEALANDPERRAVAFDAFPPRLRGRDAVGRPGPARRPSSCSGRPASRSPRVAMSPLAYSPEADAFTRRWKQLPFLQGHRAASGAIRALVELQSSNARAIADARRRTRTARRPSGCCGVGRVRSTRPPGAKLLELYGVRRPKEAAVATPGAGGRGRAKRSGSRWR